MTAAKTLRVAFRPDATVDVPPDDLTWLLDGAAQTAHGNPQTPWELVEVRADGSSVYECHAMPWPAEEMT